MRKTGGTEGPAGFIRMRIAAFRQTPEQVFRRDPGDRSLVGPYPARDEAALDWQFALLSVAAYGRSAPKRHALPAGASMARTLANAWRLRKPRITPPANVDDELRAAGWLPWPAFPDATLGAEMERSHLRVEVWENAARSLVAVAFGGTVFTSGKDWLSNLRWFIPGHRDEYSAVVDRFVPDFTAEYARRAIRTDGAVGRSMAIVSTGHSLGGGLAQQFAYAFPRERGGPKVSDVFAFDPSPVTGFYSLDPATRNANKVGLRIGRIYERGEILAVVRSFTSLFSKPSAADPTIRGVRFNLFDARNAVEGHSMVELADKMKAAAL
jgi:hypothetical protein